MEKKAPKKKPKAIVERQWTVMVYLAGDNNLREECLWERVEVNKEVAVTALFDAGKGIPPQIYATTEPDVAQIGIAIATQDDQDGDLLDQANRIEIRDTNGNLQVLDEIDTGSPRPLVNFICESIKTYPATHYMVVLGGHGSGEEGDFLSDAGSSNSLDIPKLGVAFDSAIQELKGTAQLPKEFQPKNDKIDIVGMDSCLMSMAEVAYQLRDSVSYLVGAEGFESNTGWPYQRILAPLVNKPKMGPKELAETIVKNYIRYYSDYALAGLSV
ncbi:MAG: hypothetical protein DMG06_28610, partial [Acidobacteria bacterium]